MAECPACGREYSAHTVVESGDQYNDHFPAPPYTTVKKYARICVDPDDLERATGTSAEEIGVYFHTYADLAHGPDPSLRTTAGSDQP